MAIERMAAEAETTIEAHNDRCGFVIDDRAHGVHMLLVDVLAYCEAHGIDFDSEARDARGTLDDVRS